MIYKKVSLYLNEVVNTGNLSLAELSFTRRFFYCYLFGCSDNLADIRAGWFWLFDLAPLIMVLQVRGNRQNYQIHSTVSQI